VPTANLRPLLEVLAPLHEARVKQDRDFQDLEEDIATVKAQRKKNTITLNEAARRAERDAEEAKRKAREARNGVKTNTQQVSAMNSSGTARQAAAADALTADDGLQANERNIAVQVAAEKARKNAKDILLDEAVRILGDVVGLSSADARFAVRIRNVPTLMPN
jgi:carboxyl-terminal processing protease